MKTPTYRYRVRVVFEHVTYDTDGTETTTPYASKVISESTLHSDAAKSFDSVCELFTPRPVPTIEAQLAALERIKHIGDEQEQRESLEYLQRVMPDDFPVRCDNCDITLDNVTTGMVVARDKTGKQVTICSACAGFYELLGYTIVAQAR